MKKEPTLAQKIYNFLLMITSENVMMVLFFIVQPILAVISIILLIITGVGIVSVIAGLIAVGVPLLWLALCGFLRYPILTSFIVYILIYIFFIAHHE